jgi:hypothetical protein
MGLLHKKNICLLIVIISAIFNFFTDAFIHVKKCDRLWSNTAFAPHHFTKHISQERNDISLKNKNEKRTSDDKNNDVIGKNSFFERESYEPFGECNFHFF